MSRLIRLLFFNMAAGVIVMAQSPSVSELPPEPIPSGTCTASISGYLGIEKNGATTKALTSVQIGDYVSQRLSQGYSVTLYPQPNNRVFAVATCHSKS